MLINNSWALTVTLEVAQLFGIDFDCNCNKYVLVLQPNNIPHILPRLPKGRLIHRYDEDC